MTKIWTAALLEKAILKDLGKPTPKAAFIARYTGGVAHEDRNSDEMSKLHFGGHYLTVLRALTAKNAAELSSLAPSEQWKLWLGAWKKTKSYDVRTIVMMWMSLKKQKPLREKHAKDLFAMAQDVDNWALSDGLSGMLAELLEATPSLFPLYKRWNTSKNPWLRRQSLVGIYLYARLRKKHYPPQEALKLIEPLLEDSHFYVQKAVGWTLREVDRIHPALQKQFVKKHLHRISSTAWSATSELYPLPLKRQLVTARKNARADRKSRS